MVFGKKKEDRDAVATLIGAGTTVTGDLSFRGGLHLDGRILGDVLGAAGEPSRLTIGAEGVIEGTVSVDELELLGVVHGDVLARARVELGASARVHGDVTYRVLKMTEGARVNGRLIHHADPSGSHQAPTEPDAPDTPEAPEAQEAQEARPASRGDDVPDLR